jgi:hypothetical protein
VSVPLAIRIKGQANLFEFPSWHQNWSCLIYRILTWNHMSLIERMWKFSKG